MKSLEEYTTAVFRRSEKKIAARRKRRHRLLAGAIPLCLTLCLVLTIPLWRPATTDGTPSANGQEFGTVGSSETLTVTDEAGDFTFTVTDPDDVAHAYAILTRFLSPSPVPENSPDGSDQNGASQPIVYTVRFSASQGNARVYYLSPDSRTLTGDGNSVHLSEEQWQQLKTLFDLPD